MELLHSSEKKYFVFVIYITNILLLYRIPRIKDLAIGEGNSILRVEQIQEGSQLLKNERKKQKY